MVEQTTPTFKEYDPKQGLLSLKWISAAACSTRSDGDSDRPPSDGGNEDKDKDGNDSNSSKSSDGMGFFGWFFTLYVSPIHRAVRMFLTTSHRILPGQFADFSSDSWHTLSSAPGTITRNTEPQASTRFLTETCGVICLSKSSQVHARPPCECSIGRFSGCPID